MASTKTINVSYNGNTITFSGDLTDNNKKVLIPQGQCTINIEANSTQPNPFEFVGIALLGSGLVQGYSRKSIQGDSILAWSSTGQNIFSFYVEEIDSGLIRLLDNNQKTTGQNLVVGGFQVTIKVTGGSQEGKIVISRDPEFENEKTTN